MVVFQKTLIYNSSSVETILLWVDFYLKDKLVLIAINLFVTKLTSYMHDYTISIIETKNSQYWYMMNNIHGSLKNINKFYQNDQTKIELRISNRKYSEIGMW